MILALDIGTSKFKGGVINGKGELLASARAPLTLLPQTRPAVYEIEAKSWLEALKHVTRQLALERFPELTTIVVSGNGPTLLPLDQAGNPAAPAITWLDARGQEAARILQQKGVELKRSSFFLAKAYWLRQNQPELYAKTKYFISCPEYINFYLTGQAYTILPGPGFHDYYWTPAALTALELDPARFPPFIGMGQPVGTLRRAAAGELGIKLQPGQKAVTVVSGGPDYLLALLGTGTIKPGRTCDRAGTSEGINHCSDRAVPDSELICLPHILSGLYNVSGMISTSGKALDWFREISGYKQESYEQFFEEIAAVPPGARKLLFLPYLTGERAPLWNPLARGSFIGLSLHHSRQEMGRAVAESIGYAIRQIIDRFTTLDLHVTELRLSGQQARNRTYNQLKADITGLPLLVPALPDSELVGDACLGLVAEGVYPSVEEAVGHCVRIDSIIEPNPAFQNRYAEMSQLFKQSYLSLKEIFDKLDSVDKNINSDKNIKL